MLYPKFSFILNKKGFLLTMSQTLLNKTAQKRIFPHRKSEDELQSQKNGLDSDFFLHQKESKYLSNSKDFPQLGESFPPDYGESK